MKTTNRMKTTVAMVALAAVALFADPAGAQLANASARTLGLGQNGMATARGFQAIASNPAGLGMSGGPGFSLALVPVRLRTGLDPINLADLKDVEGSVISSATKEAWLRDVANGGGETGSIGARVSGLSLQVGHVGLQVSTLAAGSLDLAPDLVELLLYGNAGRTGQPEDFDIGGSSMNAFAATTAGLSYGFSIPSDDGEMGLGATLKYTIGNALALSEGGGGTVQADPVRVQLEFPTLVIDDENTSLNHGSGVGLDVGFMMKREKVSFGATVQNLFHTFSWDTEGLVYRRGHALLEQGNNETDFDKQAASAAPSGLLTAVDDMKFDPIVSVSGGYDVSPDFTVTADLRNRFGDGMDLGPKFHGGVGAEYRGLQVLHLRGGAAVITDGFQLAGGASLVLGPVNLSAAVASRTGDLEDTTLGQFTLSFGAN
jgi:hypothetical protein